MTAVIAHPLFFNQESGGACPSSARQLDIHEISMREACRLNAKWHSMLPRTDLGNMLCGNMSIAFVAEFDGKYYATGLWSQPIIYSMCDGKTIELRRLAICDESPKYTASRMLSKMRKQVRKAMPHIKKAISYLAVDVHDGTIYKASGWRPVGDIVDARPQRLPGSPQRATGPLQTTSRKQRWEIEI